jgi:hypothetical protein
MGVLAEVLKWVLGGWLALLAALIALRMLSGAMIISGLLRIEARAPFGFDRLQLVAVTLFFAAGYVVASLYRDPADGMADIPTPLLLILVGSHGTYLATKFAALRSGLRRGS